MHLGPRAIHVGVGQSRRPARRRDGRQPQRQPVACAAARSAPPRSATSSRIRCRRCGRWHRASAGRRCFICRPRDGRRPVAVQDGQASEVWKGVDGALSEPPAVSRGRNAWPWSSDKRETAPGRSCRRTAPTRERWPLHRHTGAAGQSAADWSPDGKWIVAGGSDAQGPALFKIPVDGGAPVRLVDGQASIRSGRRRAISSCMPARSSPVRCAPGVRPDGTPSNCRRAGPPGRLSLPARRQRARCTCRAFRRCDFWLLDLATNDNPSAHPPRRSGRRRTFDITPDGKHIVFDRSRENSDIVLIDLPKRTELAPRFNARQPSRGAGP